MVTLGIDFGTSTTVAAVCHSGRDVEIVANAEGDHVVPSAIAFTPQGKVLFGRPARARRLIDPTNALYSIKRILGKSWHAHEVARFREDYPFTLEEGADKKPVFVTRAGKLSAVQAAGYLLAHLREYPLVSGQDFQHVGVTVPTSAPAGQREATLAAARHAGFANVALVDEPVAAARAYLNESSREQVVAVYDLGGGTFDFAVVRWNGRASEVLGFGGDPYLGGDDIDLRLAKWVAGRVLEADRWDVRTRQASFQTLVFVCEQAKLRLSVAETTSVNLESVDSVLAGKTVTIERTQLDALCHDLVARSFALCDEVLAKAGVTATKIDTVLMAGGTTYLPLVRDRVEKYFRKTPRFDLPPDRVVALGTALSAR